MITAAIRLNTLGLNGRALARVKGSVLQRDGIGRASVKQPLRINVIRPSANARWVDKPEMKPSMTLGGNNTNEFGYLVFE